MKTGLLLGTWGAPVSCCSYWTTLDHTGAFTLETSFCSPHSKVWHQGFWIPLWRRHFQGCVVALRCVDDVIQFHGWRDSCRASCDRRSSAGGAIGAGGGRWEHWLPWWQLHFTAALRWRGRGQTWASHRYAVSSSAAAAACLQQSDVFLPKRANSSCLVKRLKTHRR